MYDTPVHGRAIGVVQGSSVGASSNLGALPGKPVSQWQRRKERSRRDKRVNPMASVQVWALCVLSLACSHPEVFLSLCEPRGCCVNLPLLAPLGLVLFSRATVACERL